jgi:hypothetical protein
MAKRKNVDDRRLEKIKQHPESITIEIGGEEFLFLLCGLGAKLAREKGKDPIPPIIDTLEKIAPAVVKSGLLKDGKVDMETVTPAIVFALMKELITGEFFDNLIVVIWWGVLAAQPDTELEDLEILVTPIAMKQIMTKVMPRMMSYSQDLDKEDIKSENGDDSEGPEGN